MHSTDSHRALLEVITVRLATHVGAIDDYVQRILLYHTIDGGNLSKLLKLALEDFTESGFITMDKFGGYDATRLSQAFVASHLTPEDGLFLQEVSQRALKAFVMDGEMYIFYMFTPVTITGFVGINWIMFRKEIESPDESGLRVLKCVGISPAYTNRMYVYSRLSLRRPNQ